MAPKIITLVRHGQAHHNASRDPYLHDPYLTPLGEAQCHLLSEMFPSEPPVDLLVSSPMKRTIQTTLLGFKGQIASGIKVELLAELQESSDSPCDTGSSRDVLEKEELFQGLDFSGLPDDWTSKKGKWAPYPFSLKERARTVRQWIKSRSEGHVVLVLHGNFLHYVTENRDGCNNYPGTSWKNTEFRSYVFADEDEDEDDVSEIDESDQGEDNASLIETDESKERGKRSEGPLSARAAMAELMKHLEEGT